MSVFCASACKDPLLPDGWLRTEDVSSHVSVSGWEGGGWWWWCCCSRPVARQTDQGLELVTFGRLHQEVFVFLWSLCCCVLCCAGVSCYGLLRRCGCCGCFSDTVSPLHIYNAHLLNGTHADLEACLGHVPQQANDHAAASFQHQHLTPVAKHSFSTSSRHGSEADLLKHREKPH